MASGKRKVNRRIFPTPFVSIFPSLKFHNSLLPRRTNSPILYTLNYLFHCSPVPRHKFIIAHSDSASRDHMTLLTKQNELGLQNRNLGLTFGAGLSAWCTTLYDKSNIRREYLIVFLLPGGANRADSDQLVDTWDSEPAGSCTALGYTHDLHAHC